MHKYIYTHVHVHVYMCEAEFRKKQQEGRVAYCQELKMLT